MMMRRAGPLLLLVVSMSLACTPTETPPEGGVDSGADADVEDSGTDAETDADEEGGAPGAIAVFEPSEQGSLELWSAPFPSDLFLGEDGTVDIGSVENGTSSIESALAGLNRRRGFCRTCVITFPIEGELDPSSVPEDATQDAQATIDDPIVLMRADGEGELIPLLVDWSRQDQALIIRPRWGIVLEPETSYIAALTTDLQAPDGSALAPSTTFSAIRDRDDGSHPRARSIVEPALSALEAAGLARADVVALAPFTTGETESHLRELREIIAAAPIPVVTVERVFVAEEGELDALLGRPSEDRPGLDVPPADGVGEYSVVHDAMSHVILGTFDSPRIVEGSGTDVGGLRRDESGHVVAAPDTVESVPFVLILPVTEDRQALPAVLVHPGMPSSKRIGLRIGNTFARMGMAVLSIDPFQMGGRAPSATDEINEYRGLDGLDGIAEADDSAVALRYTGLDSFMTTGTMDADIALASTSQAIVDAAVALRALRESDLTPLGALQPDLVDLGIDGEQLYYVGQSYGSYTGMSVLAIDRQVQAAVFAVGPLDMMTNSICGPENRSLYELVVGPLFGARGTFDGVTRRMILHPLVNLARWYLEPTAPAANLRYLFEAPLDAVGAPDVLWIHGDHDELIGATNGEEILGIVGVPVGGVPLELITAEELSAPLSGNVSTPNGDVTAAGWVYEGTHSMIRRKYDSTLWDAPFVPPFEAFDEPAGIVNPIEAVHEQIGRFFQSRLEGGRAVVIDPFEP